MCDSDDALKRPRKIQAVGNVQRGAALKPVGKITGRQTLAAFGENPLDIEQRRNLLIDHRQAVVSRAPFIEKDPCDTGDIDVVPMRGGRDEQEAEHEAVE